MEEMYILEVTDFQKYILEVIDYECVCVFAYRTNEKFSIYLFMSDHLKTKIFSEVLF